MGSSSGKNGMKILLHICCGPCSIYPVRILREEGHDIHGYYYNPNIHPYREYIRRRDALAEWAESINLPVIYSDDYDLREYLRRIVYREAERCRFCYSMRLEKAAFIARRGKFDALTTTLLYSKFQKHSLIEETGKAAARGKGVEFLYRDFRDGWKEGVERSKQLGMYRQQYCGCIFSEKERYYGSDRSKSDKG